MVANLGQQSSWKNAGSPFSSALGINVFQYWKSIKAVPVIASQCGLCRSDSQVSCDIHFEEKYPISDSFGYHPNIDVVIHNKSSAKFKRFAVECKFSEAYGAYRHGGLKAKYFGLDNLWSEIPNLMRFSRVYPLMTMNLSICILPNWWNIFLVWNGSSERRASDCCTYGMMYLVTRGSVIEMRFQCLPQSQNPMVSSFIQSPIRNWLSSWRINSGWNTLNIFGTLLRDTCKYKWLDLAGRLWNETEMIFQHL